MILNHSDDSNTKQTGNNNVAKTKQSSSTGKQLSILKFNKLFTKHKCDSNVGRNVSKKAKETKSGGNVYQRAKETNANANMSVLHQIKDAELHEMTAQATSAVHLHLQCELLQNLYQNC